MLEVKAPALVGQRQNGSRRTGTNCAFALLTPPYDQALLAIQPLGHLAVDRDALTPQQDVQTTITEPAALLCQLAQNLLQHVVISTAYGYELKRPQNLRGPGSRAEIDRVWQILAMKQPMRITPAAQVSQSQNWLKALFKLGLADGNDCRIQKEPWGFLSLSNAGVLQMKIQLRHS